MTDRPHHYAEPVQADQQPHVHHPNRTQPAPETLHGWLQLAVHEGCTVTISPAEVPGTATLSVATHTRERHQLLLTSVGDHAWQVLLHGLLEAVLDRDPTHPTGGTP